MAWPPMPDNLSEDSDHSDHPVVNELSNARKAPDSTESYDPISQDWAVKSTAPKPTHNSDSPMNSEEAEQHHLEDEWERCEEVRRATS
jgi:hypothetical protein